MTVQPEDLIERFPEHLRLRLRPAADMAVQLIGMTPTEAERLAFSAGFTLVSIDIPHDGSLALTTDLRVGRIRGLVRDGLIQTVLVG